MINDILQKVDLHKKRAKLALLEIKQNEIKKIINYKSKF